MSLIFLKACGLILNLLQHPTLQLARGWGVWAVVKERMSVLCVFVLELGNRGMLALTIQVHTSANAVLMKPFITSSQLNLHHLHTRRLSLALLFSSI